MDHCSVTVTGVIGGSPTASYSTDLNIFDPAITPDSDCKLLPPDPDYGKMTIPPSIKSYEATVFMDIRSSKPLRGEVSSAGHRLEPWQGYVQWSLNGEFDLNLTCRSGFKLVSFKGAGSQSELFDPNTARLYASEGAPASLTIVCRRDN